MSEKHLAKGSTLPPYAGKLRVYSMRYCPYAQRLHIVLDAKAIPYDVVNINLSEKPEWLTSKSPFGKVPALEIKDGLTIYESLVTADYVDEAYPQKTLSAKDPLRRAQDRLIIEHFNKVIIAYYKAVFNKEEASKDFIEGLEELQAQMKKRSTKYLHGNDAPGMVDYMIWPWFERFPIMPDMVGDKYRIESGKFDTLLAWMSVMKNDPAITPSYLTPEIHKKFISSRLSGVHLYDGLMKNRNRM